MIVRNRDSGDRSGGSTRMGAESDPDAAVQLSIASSTTVAPVAGEARSVVTRFTDMPPPAKALRAPVLPKHLEPRVIAKLAAGDLIEQCRIDGCALAEIVAERVRFDGVRLVGGTLGASKLAHLAWLDVACERCDLSMIVWPGAKLTRIEVRGSRMTGAKLVEGQLESVRFVDCHLDYATFTDTRFRQVSFESCRLEEADFRGADLTGTSFVNCELRGADFGRAKLQGADVSTSRCSDIRIAPGDVRGLVVNREQAAVLATLFGLVVRDG